MNKTERYHELLLQLGGLIEGEKDETSIFANVAALIHQTFRFWWTGFYRVVDGELLLGPFQGPVACYHIAKGRGVCGTAWADGATVIVPNVELFPGHIACSSESKSEIVIPVMDGQGNVRAVLDIDSEHLNTFDNIDQEYLEHVCGIIAKNIY